MALFFFHLRVGKTLYEDSHGGEFSDLRAAWSWALHEAEGMIGPNALEGPINQQWIEIHDAEGTTVATLALSRVLSLN